ncbi:MAG: ATP-binding protein [Legionellaceae bacterium]|nr:ATP-binding protein [Legionellaceae bacterium]
MTGSNDYDSEKRAVTVRELDKAMSNAYGAETFEESLHLIAKQARLIVGAHQAALSYIPDQDFKVAVHAHSFSEKYEKYNAYDVMPTGKGIWSVALKNKKATIMTQKELISHPRWKNFSGLKTTSGLEHPPMRGWLAAPICRRGGGDVIGLLQLSDKYSGDFTQEDGNILSLFGNIAALVFELQYANQELTQFAHVASHDLKAPLNTIKGFMELVEKNNQDVLDEKNLNFIHRAIANTDKMTNLLDSLLLYSRVHTREPKAASFDCNQLVKEVLETIPQEAEQPKFTIKFKHLPTIVADRNQISQVFSNLISNAVKYRCTDRKLEIDIQAEKQEDSIQFSVKDNGIGIEPQYFDQIFGIFQRLHNNSEYPGTGVGLALVRRIVHRHGGRIWVESTPGESTTFYFTIPSKNNNHRDTP